MKRSQMCKKVNRNNNSFNHFNHKTANGNPVSPEILVGQIWLQEDEPTAVEIIELNTSDEFDSSPDETQNNNLDHIWSYTTANERLQKIEDNYKINKKARERRRLNYEKNFLSTKSSTNNNRSAHNNHYSSPVNHTNENTLLNHKVNCFTIINKHFINSDTSSDGEFADVEIITSNDIITEPNNWEVRNNSYKEEIITYDPEFDNDTRTIWIYSFKNKHLLGEDEFTTIGPKETRSGTTSSSLVSEEGQTKDKSTNVCRVGSPIPPTNIPRLNLSIAQTLSTVTEISEPHKQVSPNESNKSPKNKFQKPRNSWFLNESEKLSGRSIPKFEKSTNIVNWMALSPREKRRRSKEQGDKWEGSLLKLGTFPFEELSDNIQHQISEKSGQNNAIRLQVDVDVHVSVNEKTPEKRSLGTPNSVEVNIITNTGDVSPNSKVKNDENYFIGRAQDRGDHGMKFEQTQEILCVNKTKPDNLNLTGPVGLTLIERPVQRFDRDAFEREEGIERETASYDYLTNKYQCVPVDDNDADNVWIKNNIPLLKPSEWNEYLQTTEATQSINLSICTLTEERPSRFKRFINYINCCKIMK